MRDTIKTMIFAMSMGFIILMLIVLFPFLLLVSRIPVSGIEEHDRSPI